MFIYFNIVIQFLIPKQIGGISDNISYDILMSGKVNLRWKINRFRRGFRFRFDFVSVPGIY